MTVAHVVKCVQAVVKPFKVFGGTRRVWYKVLVAWLVAAVLAIPKPLSFVQTEHQQQVRRSSSEDHTQTVTVYRCESAGYTAEWQRKLYFTFMISVVFIIPASIMIFCSQSPDTVGCASGTTQPCQVSVYRNFRPKIF